EGRQQPRARHRPHRRRRFPQPGRAAPDLRRRVGTRRVAPRLLRGVRVLEAGVHPRGRVLALRERRGRWRSQRLRRHGRTGGPLGRVGEGSGSHAVTSMFVRLSDVELDAPVLVMGMEGWIDAGLGAGAAMATLVDQVPNQLIGRFDTDLLLDQRARRPVLRIVDGVTSPLKWPEIELRAGEDRAGKSVLLLVGPEPDMRWKSFTSTVVGLATEMGVRLAVGLGAFPAP